LIFSDPRYPDFDLDLWLEADEGRRGAMPADEAVQEANRWLALVEALQRRHAPRPAAPVEPIAASQPPPFDATYDGAYDGDEEQIG
jgi:hypothetical protein